MAFEVARVHQLICSRVEGRDVFGPFRNVNHSSETDPSPRHSYNPEGACVLTQCPADFSSDSRGFHQEVEKSNPLSESSLLCTESESDEGYDILQCLAQQTAQLMLGEEDAKAETCSGVLQGTLETQNLLSADERVSPSYLLNGGWSLGPPLTGGQSSSNGSSRTSSQVSSPSSVPSCDFQDAWDTLDAAAVEVERLKMNERKGIPACSTERPSQTKVEKQALRAQLNPHNRTSGHLQGRSTSSQSARRKEENPMVNSQAQMNWHSKGAAMNTMASQVRCQYPQYQPRQQAFSPDYQQTVNNHRLPGKLIDYDCFQRNRQTFPNGGSNVQVVFLGAVSGKEAGTGVFLPRTFASAPEHKKKTEVSPLSPPMHGCEARVGSHVKTSKGKLWPTFHRVNLPQPVVREPCLPTEWTY
ncbi:uncharacterized protein [Physcomitrium patens]|uniref:Uncharacterized protein n=1 Tax=Physcomitrium patens TaxID=3218 RepID=A0A2K1KKF1_PHYPA|nr:uncharacterized protein LOC112282109 [Physcomitrium patens]XP_024375098.1 uncharacterized protein LOC112282109 [Physcomitrium patens]XP_024375099.1 uncharacterized protein LOC112282109 [Physcomitrium patens]XP_024375100.1 uncharacterized protein LOC112282109 [Physcomitrium patens]XP_024375101.1 uncharacterized protein LOC112282109 [Physcomitrium patens]PNR54249.1 hypothetical protein PHYPA_007926 [Physcomitrium patens]|eukprot:XP_024375097.1 uncharacterized protein LOC112282109 [Physcomitrella patens]